MDKLLREATLKELLHEIHNRVPAYVFGAITRPTPDDESCYRWSSGGNIGLQHHLSILCVKWIEVMLGAIIQPMEETNGKEDDEEEEEQG